MRIILASQSPRRKDLMDAMGLAGHYDVIPSNYDEQLDDSRPPYDVAVELGLGKAMDIARQYPDALVIGSDCIVSINGRQLGKPTDIEDARRMLRLAASAPNSIISSVAVVCLTRNIKLTGAEECTVIFKPWDEKRVEAYLASGDYADKAGAYGVQSGAAPLIERLEGNFDTIMGLPTTTLASYLQRCGVKCRPANITPPQLGQ